MSCRIKPIISLLLPPRSFLRALPPYARMLTLIYSYEPKLEQFANEYFNYYNSLACDMRSATVSVIRPSGCFP